MLIRRGATVSVEQGLKAGGNAAQHYHTMTTDDIWRIAGQ